MSEHDEFVRARKFAVLHDGDSVRGHYVFGGRLITGTVGYAESYTENQCTDIHWTITIKENGIYYTVVWSSIQLLDSNGYPITSVPATDTLVKEFNEWADSGDPIKQDGQSIGIVKEIKVTAADCHPECCDGYCHRKYSGA